MEIASNDGYLLRNYVDAGVPVLGVDPARNIASVAEENGVPTVCDFFGAEVAAQLRAEGRRASVLHANNVLAHVPDVNGVVAGIATILADDGVAVIETPYLRDLVDELEFDTIYHEHLFYYSAPRARARCSSATAWRSSTSSTSRSTGARCACSWLGPAAHRRLPPSPRCSRRSAKPA